MSVLFGGVGGRGGGLTTGHIAVTGDGGPHDGRICLTIKMKMVGNPFGWVMMSGRFRDLHSDVNLCK